MAFLRLSSYHYDIDVLQEHFPEQIARHEKLINVKPISMMGCFSELQSVYYMNFPMCDTSSRNTLEIRVEYFGMFPSSQF
jgi:hypothetical protein